MRVASSRLDRSSSDLQPAGLGSNRREAPDRKRRSGDPNATREPLLATEPIFDRLQARFSNCTSCEHEVIAAGASGDLAYIVAFEHTTASVNGSPSLPYTLRATLFRREDRAWKVVHRHADPVASENAAELVQRLVATDS